MAFKNTRAIHTGLYGVQAKEVIDRVHGQLSDGKWENSPGYDKYWTNFRVDTADDGEVIINVNADCYYQYCSRYLVNPFEHMSDDEIKTWIARKIKAVVKDEIKDENLGNDAWNRRNPYNSIYLGHCDEKYGTLVTIADIYCTYEALLGRNVGITKYDSSTICRVFGSKRSDEDAAKVKAIREMKDSIYAKYAQKRDDLKKAKDEAIAKFEKEYQENLQTLFKEQEAEIESLKLIALASSNIG